MGNVQSVMEGRAARLLHTMIGPQHLRPIGKSDDLEGLTTGIGRSKGAVRRWMLVLRQDHMLEAARKLIDEGYDLVTAGHGETAAGAEIVLHIDSQQNIAVCDLLCHRRSFLPGHTCWKASRSEPALLCAVAE